MAGIHCRSAAITHVGKVRRVNEDAYLDNAALNLWVVADGMGGHEAGDVASQLIISTLNHLTHVEFESLETYVARLEQAILTVNHKLKAEMTLKEGSHVMGSTVVAVVAAGNKAACVWAGDSRLYRLRNNMLEQLSKDHSLVQMMVDNGELTKSAARIHPQSNVITRAVGVDDNLKLELKIFDLIENDRLFLCSDGVYGELTDEQIQSILGEVSVVQTVENIQSHVLATNARDNLTAIVVDVIKA